MSSLARKQSLPRPAMVGSESSGRSGVLSGVSITGCRLPSRVPFWADVWDAERGTGGDIDGIGRGVKGGVRAVV
jgi:hypothetical protein